MTFGKALVGSVVLGALLAACSSDGATGATGPSGSVGPTGPAGPAGPPGPGSGPSVSAILPYRAFLARKLEVTVLGAGTSWSRATTVDLGQGITNDKIQVASPTALIVSITIAKDATQGPRDVLVHDGASTQVYARGFTVEQPIAVTTDGTLAQGSILFAHAANKDPSTPFDTTTAGDGILTPISFPDLKVTIASGATAQITAASSYNLDFTLLTDIDAPTTPQRVDVESGRPSALVEFPNDSGYVLAARTAIDLAAGTPATGTTAAPFDSALYAFTPGSTLGIADFEATATDPNLAPTIIVSSAGGKFAGALATSAKSTQITESSAPLYAVYVDRNGMTGAYSVVARGTTATGVAISGLAHTSASAQTLSALAAVLQGGSLDTAADEDWFVYPAAAGDVGKRVHVQTLPGDPLCDTRVDVLGPDGTTSMGGPSDRPGAHEDFTSTPIQAAGNVLIRISAGAAYQPAQKNYRAIVRLM